MFLWKTVLSSLRVFATLPAPITVYCQLLASVQPTGILSLRRTTSVSVPTSSLSAGTTVTTSLRPTKYYYEYEYYPFSSVTFQASFVARCFLNSTTNTTQCPSPPFNCRKQVANQRSSISLLCLPFFSSYIRASCADKLSNSGIVSRTPLAIDRTSC